jgi:pimeloyl-ACP methyl ester carboxylesterase
MAWRLLFGQAFEASGNVIISFEGSILNLFDQSQYANGSRAADADILIGQIPNAFLDASAFVGDVERYLVQHHLGSDPIYLTGHSLGGAEAEFVASLGPKSGATFGAPGDLFPIYNAPISGQKFINYADFGDPIGNFGFHFGAVKEVGSRFDLTLEQLYGPITAAELFHPLAHYASDLHLNSAVGAPPGPALANSITQLVQATASFSVQQGGPISETLTNSVDQSHRSFVAVAYA